MSDTWPSHSALWAPRGVLREAAEQGQCQLQLA